MISFTFSQNNIQYKKLVNGVIDQLKVSLTDRDGNEISSNFKISMKYQVILTEMYLTTYHKKNNPSTIGPDELLTVRFPDLKENQLIIPGTTKLTFNISLVGTDANRTLVKNLDRNIIRKLVVKLEGNEIVSIDD